MKMEVFNKIEEVPIYKEGDHLVLLTENFTKHLDLLRCKFKTKNLFGAIVPYVISNKKFLEEGILVISFEENVKSAFASLSNPDDKVLEQFRNFKSIWLFVDGMSPHLDFFIHTFNKIIEKEKVKVIGTGVGSRNFKPQPCLFDKAKIYQDCSLIIGTNLSIDVGVDMVGNQSMVR